MYRVEVHNQIHWITFLFYKLGLWQRDRAPTIKEWLLKGFYSAYFFSLIISFVVGACSSRTTEEAIFLVQPGIMTLVLWVKLNCVIGKKVEILYLLDEVCVYTTADFEGFTIVTDKLKKITRFSTVVFWSICCASFYCVLISPFLGNKKALFFDIAFPIDHKNDEIAFWIAFTYLAFEMVLAVIVIIFTVLMWYLMFSCALRYELLGRQISNIGYYSDERKLSVLEKNNLYSEDLMAAIRVHSNTTEITGRLDSFFSGIFKVSLVTGAVSICCSLYCLIAFNRSSNFSGQLVLLAMLPYNTFEIFMLTYFGNEIKVFSDRFTYNLFQSNWIEKPKSIKRSILVVGELLMRPYEIFVFKLYPLSLETFTRILNSAYSMFNILQNFRE